MQDHTNQERETFNKICFSGRLLRDGVFLDQHVTVPEETTSHWNLRYHDSNTHGVLHQSDAAYFNVPRSLRFHVSYESRRQCELLQITLNFLIICRSMF